MLTPRKAGAHATSITLPSAASWEEAQCCSALPHIEPQVQRRRGTGPASGSSCLRGTGCVPSQDTSISDAPPWGPHQKPEAPLDLGSTQRYTQPASCSATASSPPSFPDHTPHTPMSRHCSP